MLLEETEDDLFVTALLGRLDPQTRSFVYASAGHPPAYLLDKSGDVKACLQSTAPPLAVVGDIEFPTETYCILEPGDMLLLTTDGIGEAMSARGEYFGTDRMLEFLRSHRSLAAREAIAGLYDEVRQFVQPAKAADDITAVLVKCCCD
jgi:serine phosphatase RsbU (regulator of sigma subunit)